MAFQEKGSWKKKKKNKEKQNKTHRAQPLNFMPLNQRYEGLCLLSACIKNEQCALLGFSVLRPCVWTLVSLVLRQDSAVVLKLCFATVSAPAAVGEHHHRDVFPRWAATPHPISQ